MQPPPTMTPTTTTAKHRGKPSNWENCPASFAAIAYRTTTVSVYGTSEVRPFAIAKVSKPRGTDDDGPSECFDYTGSHLSFSTALLPVAPCGYPAGEGIEMQNSGIYGTADSPGFSTYVALGVNVQEGLKLTDYNLEKCSAYSNSSRLELRPVKNMRQSCTPWTRTYYEGDEYGNPGGLAKLHDDDQCTDTCQHSNDGECDDGEDGAEQYCACGTDCGDCGARTCSNVVRHHETLDDFTFIEPPNTGFHSEAQICGKFQQLTSSPDVASGLWKVCSETGEIDVLANSYAFGALVLTVISLVAACVEINQCVGCRRRRVDDVEDDTMIQHERAVKF